VLEVHEGFTGPEGGADFVAGDELAGVLEQDEEKLKGLLLELDADAGFEKLAGVGEELENTKRNRVWRGRLGRHTNSFGGVAGSLPQWDDTRWKLSGGVNALY
jgi:hypothetical protein